MYRLYISLVFVFVFADYGFSQQKFTLSGYIKDASNGEALMGATVYAKEIKKGTTTNTYGFYSLTVEKGTYTVEVNFIGYELHKQTVQLTKNQTLNIEMKPVSIQVEGTVISASRNDDNVNTTNMGTTVVPVETIKKMPAFFGEVDLIKTIQLLPGIQSAGEGSTGYYVRGGGLDQNLVLLDNAVIYNLGHLFGFFSIFNADAIRSVEMIKGGMPANYGGRLASVLNVTMKEGNMKKYEVDGGVGIVFARINVQGPIVKDKASFLFTARRTYIDALVQPFLDSSNPMKGLKFYFYDLNGKMNWKINDKHRIFLSGYYGTDIYGFKGDDIAMDARFYWGNGAGSFRWNYNINSKLFLNTSAMISDFYFNTDIASGDMYKLGMKSGIRDYSFNTELTYMPVAGNILKTGIDYTFHHLTPGNYEIQMGSDFNIPLPFVLNAHEFAAFVNDEIDLSDEIRLNVGLRYSYYEHTGPYTSYTPDNIGRIVDSTVYKLGDKVKSYQGLEPRVSLRFAVDKDLSIKASYTYNYQYLHQVALSSISLPTDEWILSSTDIKPQQGSQYSIGFYKNMKSNMYELSVEAYYKDMKNLTEYREGYSPFTIIMQTLDRQYTQGEGYSYGLEFLLNKTMGKLTGWLGYSLAWSKRQFAELNGGKEFYAKNDRRHDVSISLSYDILPNLTTSIVWVYATGNTMTVPIGFYFIDYQMITEYSSKNAYRVPPYHRMDISVNWIIRKTERSEHGLNFSVYNVYNRRNPFFISIGSSMNTDKMEIQNTAYQMSLFPILPSISWNFKFR